MIGKLYLIPVTLGDTVPEAVLPYKVREVVQLVNHFVVENEKTARRFIKTICPEKSQPELKIQILNKRTAQEELIDLIQPCLDGHDLGVMSEAGVPAIADPGSKIVQLAHFKGIKVTPLVGPCSIIMALMGSGLSGQNFAFNGYLPIDSKEQKRKIKQLEIRGRQEGQSQIFMETPYRNDKLLKQLINILDQDTVLSVACDLTLITETILSFPISQWRERKETLNKRPTVFIIGSS